MELVQHTETTILFLRGTRLTWEGKQVRKNPNSFI